MHGNAPHACEQNTLGVRLYTNAAEGVTFYERNDFKVVAPEAAGDNTCSHMVWMTPRDESRLSG
jgi:hypothetical protein